MSNNKVFKLAGGVVISDKYLRQQYLSPAQVHKDQVQEAKQKQEANPTPQPKTGWYSAYKP